MNRLTKSFVVGMTLVLTLSLSGCGREKVTEMPGQDATMTDSNQQTNEVEIPEHLNYMVEGESQVGTSYNIKVDADVKADGYNHVSIYSLEPVVIDDEWMDEFAKKLFDGGSYEVVKPYRICSMEELFAEKESLESMMGELPEVMYWGYHSGAGFMGVLMDIDYYISVYNGEDVKEFPEGSLIYQDELGAECRLRGYINDELWELHYVSGDGELLEEGATNFYMNQASFQAYPMNRSIQYSSFEPAGVNTFGENLLDYEEAYETAKNLIADWGFRNMELALAMQLGSSEGESYVLDGYYFAFTKEVDGTQNVYGVDSVAMMEGQSLKNGVCQEYICIFIDSDGVGRIEVSRLYEEKERLSEQPTLLSFEQVDEIAQTFMEKALAGEIEMSVGIMNIVSVEFGYAALSYDGEYSLVPVWIYVGEIFNEPYICFGVNALDGEIIFFSYQ